MKQQNTKQNSSEAAAIRFLREELQRRIEKNPSYSLRAFANTLQLNNGTLSSILNGSRPLTKKSMEKICDRLLVAPAKKQKLLNSLSVKFSAEKISLPDLRFKNGIATDRVSVQDEAFKALSEWQHWAILQLVRLDSYGTDEQQKSSKWFAARLGITEITAKLSIDRLLRLGFLTEKNGFYYRTKEKLTSPDRGVTTPALRQWQKSLRLKSIESLENDAIEHRSMTSMSMAIDPKKLNEARELIEEFQEKLSAFLEAGKKESAYQLTVSLFPLQKIENKNNSGEKK